MLQLNTKESILEQLSELDELTLSYLWANLSKTKTNNKTSFNVQPFETPKKDIEIKAYFSYFNDSNITNQFTKSGVRYPGRKSLKNKTSKA